MQRKKKNNTRLHEIVQAEQAHSPEVCGRIVALETDVRPLFAEPRQQSGVRI